MFKVDNWEKWLSQFTEVQLQDTRHRIDVWCISHIRQRILAALEWLSEVVYLDLRSWHPKYTLMMESWKSVHLLLHKPHSRKHCVMAARPCFIISSSCAAVSLLKCCCSWYRNFRHQISQIVLSIMYFRLRNCLHFIVFVIYRTFSEQQFLILIFYLLLTLIFYYLIIKWCSFIQFFYEL
jgi:hypothetical protein